MNSWSSPLGGSVKTATRVAMPLCTRSAASSAPAPPESSDTTMMSAGATGSLTTSAHPAPRRTSPRTEGTATTAAAAAAAITRIAAHLGRREFMLGLSPNLTLGTNSIWLIVFQVSLTPTEGVVPHPHNRGHQRGLGYSQLVAAPLGE